MNIEKEQIRVGMSRLHWLNRVEPEVLENMVAQSRILILRDKVSFASRGQPRPELAIIHTGQLMISLTSASGKRRVIAYLGSGQAFGLVQVLDKTPTQHDAEAVGPCGLILVPQQALLDGMKESHTLVMGLVKVLCARSRLAYQSTTDQSLLSLTGRVARMLLSLGTAYGTQHRDVAGHRTVNMSQAGLSDLLGVARQSLNTELKKLERMELIRMSYSVIELIDLAGLEKLVEID